MTSLNAPIALSDDELENVIGGAAAQLVSMDGGSAPLFPDYLAVNHSSGSAGSGLFVLNVEDGFVDMRPGSTPSIAPVGPPEALPPALPPATPAQVGAMFTPPPAFNVPPVLVAPPNSPAGMLPPVVMAPPAVADAGTAGSKAIFSGDYCEVR